MRLPLPPPLQDSTISVFEFTALSKMHLTHPVPSVGLSTGRTQGKSIVSGLSFFGLLEVQSAPPWYAQHVHGLSGSDLHSQL